MVWIFLNSCLKEGKELPQINLARIIIPGLSIFVKVLQILQNISYEEGYLGQWRLPSFL
jgi:hypothetical protein